MKPIRFAASLLLIAALFLPPAAAAQDFQAFVREFEDEAARAGISRDIYRSATEGISPVANIPGLVTSQPEFTTSMWDYINQRVSEGRIARGRAAMARNSALFDRIGSRFGVDPHVLGAIWGMETDYGSILGNARYIQPIIPALATLIFHQRDRYAEDKLELIAALRLIQDHGWTAQSLVGSWAGAIGHTQVIASGLLAHGTDGDDDGRIDPHNSLADALATTAVFLRALGYQPGLDWGFEVTVPDGFDYAIATRNEMKRVGFFAERGVRRVAGREFADAEQPVFLYVPAGQNGPKFLMTPNYLVFKAYNFSDSYAMSVAHLTDRLKGAGPLVASWPVRTQFPNLSQRRDIQTWLKQLGHYDGAVDGRIGPITQEAYQRFQMSRGLVADGFVTAQSWSLLRDAVR